MCQEKTAPVQSSSRPEISNMSSKQSIPQSVAVAQNKVIVRH